MERSFALEGDAGRAQDALDARLDELAALAAQGNRAAFGEIYSMLVDDLYAFVRGQCSGSQTAEDIVAEVFLKAWRSAGTYKAGSYRFRAWIFAIARNETRDYWRSLSRATSPLTDDMPEQPQEQADPERPDARNLTERALAVLTESQREVVVLRYFAGKSHAEIARITGRREGAIRALLHRALRRMRKVLPDAAP
mgnify:CR=1 FL=1